MNNPSAFHQSLRDKYSKWKSVEKEVSLVGGDTSVSTERSRDLCDALLAGDLARAERLCNEAISLLAIEGSVHYMALIRTILEGHEALPLHELIPGYNEIVRRAQSIESIDEADPTMSFCSLKRDLQTIQDSRPTINNAWSQQRRNARRFVVTIGVAVLCIAAAVAAAITF